MTISFDFFDLQEHHSLDSLHDFLDPLSAEIARQSNNDSTVSSFSDVWDEFFSDSTIFKETTNTVEKAYVPLNATFCDLDIDFPSEISCIDDLDYDSGSAKARSIESDVRSDVLVLDVASFFAENEQIPVTIPKTAQNSSIPLDFSTDKNRLGQDEDKATNSKTKIDTTTKNPSLTPAFKAAVQGQNRVVFQVLPPRRAKEAARSKITSCIKRKI